MARRFPLPVRLILPTALTVLVVVLATLQFHWLGQVSRAERERLQASLRARAQEFADAFDSELLWIQMAFQSGDAAVSGDAFARRFEAWREKARYPRMVREVYLLEGDAGQAAVLRRFDPVSRRFVDAAWPAEFAPIRSRVLAWGHLASSELAAFNAKVQSLRTLVPDPKTGAPAAEARNLVVLNDPIVASIPAVLVPVPGRPEVTGFGNARAPARALVSVRLGDRFLVVQLDREFIRSSMLPALAAQYLSGGDADTYRVAILDRADAPAHVPRPLVFSRGLDDGRRIDPARADASVALFALRFDLGSRVAARLGPAPSSGIGDDSFGRTERQVAVRAEATHALPPPAGVLKSDTVAVYVQSRNANGRVLPPGGSLVNAGAWQLVLQHPAGSLDAAVSQARRRNVWLSFGILAVLAAGVALVLVNAQRAQRLAAQQMHFVATVTHELRTPLAVIRSAAQNLSAGVVHDADRTRHYGEIIDTEGRRLSDMVEQVLEYAGVSGDRAQSAEDAVDVGALVQDVADSLAATNQVRGTEVAVDVADDLPAVRGSDAALRRAFNNLIVNGLKHGAEGGWLGVVVRRAGPGSGGGIEVIVQDRGRGIAASDLPHIFDAFYRGADAVERQIPGNGLGLSLVKRIIDAHRGRIIVKSSPGQGATFVVHLPIASDASPRTSSSRTGRGRLSAAERHQESAG